MNLRKITVLIFDFVKDCVFLGLIYHFIINSVIFQLVFGSYVCYFVTSLFVIPGIEWMKYRRYLNIKASSFYNPIFADLLSMLKSERAGRAKMYFIKNETLSEPERDLKLAHANGTCFFFINSQKALKEFVNLNPYKIDRSDFFKIFYAKMYPGAADQMRHTQNFIDRRDLHSKILGIKSASQHRKTMLRTLKQHSQRWIEGETFNFKTDSIAIAFKIISRILLGDNYESKMEKFNYTDNYGEVSKLTFLEFYPRVMQDLFDALTDFKAFLFPVLNYWGLTKPHSTNILNIKECWRVIGNFINKEIDNKFKDKDGNESNSLLKKVIDSENIDLQTIKMDYLGIMLAAYETSAHIMLSSIYLLKRNPDKLLILQKELKAYGVSKDSIDDDNEVLMDKIMECEYLSYVTKEALRMDPPIQFTLPYRCYEETTICGVPIKKNAELFVNLSARHYDSAEWYEPDKFIPERFDPSHPYFNKPNQKDQIRDSTSFIPFGVGPRTCCGKEFAMYEMRIVLAYIITKLDFDIDDKLLKKTSICCMEQEISSLSQCQ